jgi:hypothetical protein
MCTCRKHRAEQPTLLPTLFPSGFPSYASTIKATTAPTPFITRQPTPFIGDKNVVKMRVAGVIHHITPYPTPFPTKKPTTKATPAPPTLAPPTHLPTVFHHHHKHQFGGHYKNKKELAYYARLKKQLLVKPTKGPTMPPTYPTIVPTPAPTQAPTRNEECSVIANIVSSNPPHPVRLLFEYFFAATGGPELRVCSIR